MNTGGGGTLTGKRVLVELSHAIERYALAAEPDEPLVVIALFQKAVYFGREFEVYRRIAERGAITLVGLAEDHPPEMPPGVRYRLFAADDPLAREWSVTVLGPRGGASLVAIDQEMVSGDAPTIEQGRLFSGRWAFRRDMAYNEVLRLRTQLELPAVATVEVDEVLRRVLVEPEPPVQQWWDSPLRFLASRVDEAFSSRDRARGELDAVRAGSAERDPRTGLLTPAFLQRWTTGLGSGTLSVGLVALRVVNIGTVRDSYGMRAEMGAIMAVAGLLQSTVSEGDRVIRVGRGEFLLVLPGWRQDRVTDLTHRLAAGAARLDEQFPFVPLETVVTATVTRDRPLPVSRLMEELDDLHPGTDAVRLLAR